jgi:hypothetical protein
MSEPRTKIRPRFSRGQESLGATPEKPPVPTLPGVRQAPPQTNRTWASSPRGKSARSITREGASGAVRPRAGAPRSVGTTTALTPLGTRNGPADKRIFRVGGASAC